MKAPRDWSISLKIALVFIAMLTALSGFTMLYFLYELGQYREASGLELRNRLMAEAKDRQRQVVGQAYDVIKYFYDVSQDDAALKKRAHDHLKAVVDAVAGQAKAYYDAHKDAMPREDIEAQQKLLRCKSFDEVRSVQSKFIETAVAQYRDNAARLFKLGQDIVAKSTPRAH